MAADENITPRHGRHAAAPRPDGMERQQAADLRADDSAESRPRMAPESIPQVVSISDGDQETRMGDAPRPIGVDPEETGSFRRISAHEGARVTTRANASETASFSLENARPVEAVRMSTAGRPKVKRRETQVKSNKRVFVILGVAALAVVLIMAWLVTRALVSVDRQPEEVVNEQVQVAPNESLEYRGTTYALTQQESGAYALTSTSEGAEGTAVLCELPGTPVALILYDAVFVIPENLPDGTWDLMAHPLGGGAVTQQVGDSEGNPVVGQGRITEATLAGTEVVVVTEDGSQESVSLV